MLYCYQHPNRPATKSTKHAHSCIHKPPLNPQLLPALLGHVNLLAVWEIKRETHYLLLIAYHHQRTHSAASMITRETHTCFLVCPEECNTGIPPCNYFQQSQFARCTHTLDPTPPSPRSCPLPPPPHHCQSHHQKSCQHQNCLSTTPCCCLLNPTQPCNTHCPTSRCEWWCS